MFMKKYILVAVFILTLLAGCGQSDKEEGAGTTESELKPLDFVIDWLPVSTHLGVYYAIDIGEFEKAGYSPTIPCNTRC